MAIGKEIHLLNQVNYYIANAKTDLTKLRQTGSYIEVKVAMITCPYTSSTVEQEG